MYSAFYFSAAVVLQHAWAGLELVPGYYDTLFITNIKLSAICLSIFSDKILYLGRAEHASSKWALILKLSYDWLFNVCSNWSSHR